MDYNPRSPQNLGMEWVPIQQGDFRPDNFNEYGYVMRLDHSATIVSGGIGINELPPQVIASVAEGINIYPYPTFDDTGPVRLVTIPVQSASITGTDIIVIGSTAVSALSNPSDFNYVNVFDTAVPDTDVLGLNFGVTAFANELTGKRIVKLRLIYTAASDTNTAPLAQIEVGIARAANIFENFTYQTGIDGSVSPGALVPLVVNSEFNYVDLGDWNPVWGPGITQNFGMPIYPWRYNELANLDATAPPNVRQIITIQGDMQGLGTVSFGYVALQVFYCEETRVAYGGRRTVTAIVGDITTALQKGENRLPIRSTAFATSTTLTPGNYVVTATNRPVSNIPTAKLAPVYAAIRELNETAPVDGLIIKPTIVIDDPFASEDTPVIVDISLFTAVAAVTGCHVYSNQISAPIYGTITATQDIHVRGEIGAATSYGQVRFYARRFGETTIPLVATLGASTATITPDNFDLLDEIFDGWKEVTLDLSPALSLTGDAIQTIVWSSAGEVVNNQWQILGASSYSTSPNINVATYDPPGGGTTELTWKSPNVTSSTVDAQSDATVILAQNLPAPTNFVLTTASQAVTGVAEECGVPNGCVPTGIDYINLAWDSPIACDEFDRVAASWTAAPMSSGDTWSVPAFTGTATVDGERGVIVHNAVNDYFQPTVNLGTPNQQVSAVFTPTVTSTGAAITYAVMARQTDPDNYYAAILDSTTTGSMVLRLQKRVATALTTITSVTLTNYTPSDTTSFRVTLRTVGSWIYALAYDVNAAEAPSWLIIVQDTSLTTGNIAGIRTRLTTGNTNPTPVTIYVDSFLASDARYVDASIEIQRQDDLDGENWQTIVNSENLCFSTMKDFEARVGEESRYRARYCDSLDFCGPWVTGAATLAAPGVTGSSSITGEGVLVFTSNRQPLSNLAYTMTWNGQPVETFAFPEADTQVFQRMYGRDFQVAFRPLERGGEQFDRVIIIGAAAIPIPSLANFHSLRDLAWADLPYICVRDELGNRWYANVLVPSGEVKRGRRIYLAQIRVTEVADTAAPVT